MQISGFDWDSGNSEKCRKHGLTLAEIEQVFFGQMMVLPDPAHSETEERQRGIGRTASGRHVFVVFTIRKRGDRALIRPISARFMHRREIEAYEKENPGL